MKSLIKAIILIFALQYFGFIHIDVNWNKVKSIFDSSANIINFNPPPQNLEGYHGTE